MFDHLWAQLAAAGLSTMLLAVSTYVLWGHNKNKDKSIGSMWGLFHKSLTEERKEREQDRISFHQAREADRKEHLQALRDLEERHRQQEDENRRELLEFMREITDSLRKEP